MKMLSLTKAFPIHGWIGIFLIITFWYLNWTLENLRTHWGFFPLWLGYCLTVDSFVKVRKGSSLFSRSFKKYLSLFLISAPCWWLFELFNSHLNNWQYVGKEYFTELEYVLLASLSFSTVIPAVFCSAELVSSFKWINKFNFSFKLTSSNKTLITFFLIGTFLLASILIWPDIFYPFIWITAFLIIEPFNIKSQFSSLLEFTQQRNWKPILSLSIGCLICAFFWEMWNFYSYPKWIYHLPHISAPKLFEMPLPGYIGYIPFSFELFSITSLFYGIFKLKLTEYLYLE